MWMSGMDLDFTTASGLIMRLPIGHGAAITEAIHQTAAIITQATQFIIPMAVAAAAVTAGAVTAADTAAAATTRNRLGIR